MDLRTPYPYALLRHGIINSYPSLDNNIKADIAIIGAGISGALLADRLLRAGYDVVVADRRHAGTGSTAASTSLLQYEIDTPLYKLIDLVGKKTAVASYKLCRKAIYDLEKICSRLNGPGLFEKKPSFQFASFKKDVDDLQKEYELRRQEGFDVSLFGQDDVQNKFGFSSPAGLFSSDGAIADAYLLTHRLLSKNISKGLRVYDNTEITHIRYQKRGVELQTADKKKILARKLVIACGYESQKYVPKKIQDNHATFAIASEPFQHKNFWYKNAMIWETARPYLYLRTTSDNRIIAGGRDIPFSNPKQRDRMLSEKAKSIERSIEKLFPEILFKTDFKWAGTFAATRDGLPYIGSIPERPNTYFALGFGGNGITFSVIATQIIHDLLRGIKNQAANMFRFDR